MRDEMFCGEAQREWGVLELVLEAVGGRLRVGSMAVIECEYRPAG